MQVKTFNSIVTFMCDYFDTLISPKLIARNNTNIIYLILKAIAKGYEVINNTCVVLNNKFNPESCSVEDLESVSKLVGTSRFLGSGSGLYISVTNKGATALTLLAGFYHYALDESTTFTFEVLSNRNIERNGTITFFSFSDQKGSYSVTEQDNITVYSDLTIPSDFVFSCSDNSSLLGTTDETDTEFRNRILTDTTRQNSLVELQETIKNLPFIFDARLYFNNTLTSVTYDGITIPPYYLAIFFSGEARSELAEVITEKTIYPTVQTPDSFELNYKNSVFVSGSYAVYVIPFKKTQYSVNVSYKIDSVYNDAENIELSIRTQLLKNMNKMVHTDIVNEAEVYNQITLLNIAGASILNVDLFVSGTAVNYVSVPYSRIPELVAVNFTKVE